MEQGPARVVLDESPTPLVALSPFSHHSVPAFAGPKLGSPGAGGYSRRYAAEVNGRIRAAHLAASARTRGGDEGVWVRSFVDSLSRLHDQNFEGYLRSLEGLAGMTQLIAK